MKIIIATLILTFSCAAELKLSEKAKTELKELLNEKKEEIFVKKLEEISKRKTKESVLLILELMIELPWDKNLIPKHRGDYRMRKIRVERYFDKLVSVRPCEKLSANYFRALQGKRNLDPEKAKNELLTWFKTTAPKMHWDEDTLRLKEK